MCGEEWVFFNAAQVLPCYVIQLYESKRPRHAVPHPPPLAAGLIQQQQEDDKDVSEKERERQKKDKLLARVSKLKAIHCSSIGLLCY